MICKITNFFANFFQPKKIRKIRILELCWLKLVSPHIGRITAFDRDASH